jgi:hypothetical protein
MSELRKLRTACGMGVAHNGIIYLTSSASKTVTFSDTMEFIMDYMSLIVKSRDYYKDPDTLTLLDRLTDSKLAVLDGDGHCELTGGGWIKDKGVYYSNNGYMQALHTPLFGKSKYSLYFDPFSGKYDFDVNECPACEDGGDGYCSVCSNFVYCYGDFEERENTLEGK